MKRISLFLLATTLLISYSVFSSFGQTKKTETIIVKTNIYCDHCMECSSCSGKIEKDLGFEKGIKLVKLDDKAMTLTITYNPSKINPDKIRLKISQYGFDADDVKADPIAYSKLDDCCKKPD